MENPQSEPIPATRRSWGKSLTHGAFRLIRFALLLVLLAAALLWGYCRWMEYFIERQLHVFWSKEIFSIDQVDFSPWEHKFTLYGLRWNNPPGYDPSRKAIEIRRLRADLELDMLKDGILHFKSVEIGEIKLNMEFRTRSLAMLALQLDDPAPEVNLYEAVQFQLAEAPVDENRQDETPQSSPLFRTVRIDTLSVGESQVEFGNISNIPGLSIVLNLSECFSTRLAPYNRYGIGFDRITPPGDAIMDIIDTHCRKVQAMLAHRLELSSDTLTQIYHETFSGKLRECERKFEAIRDWEGLVKAARSIDWLESKESLLESMDNFLKKTPHTQLAVKQIRDEYRALAAGVISEEELASRLDFIRRSRNTEQALAEWAKHEWWKFW